MAPILSVDTTPSNYGTKETLKCTDPNYTSGNDYNWKKDGVSIFNNVGEINTTGKYSESIDGTTFKLVINSIVASDEGFYKANHNFADSNTLDLKVESQGTVTAKLTSDNLLEVTFHQIYPKTISAAITCDNQLTSGSFLSPVEDGDRFTIIWQSSETFCTVPKTCSAEVTLRTTFTTDFTVTSEEKFIRGAAAFCAMCSAVAVAGSYYCTNCHFFRLKPKMEQVQNVSLAPSSEPLPPIRGTDRADKTN